MVFADERFLQDESYQHKFRTWVSSRWRSTKGRKPEPPMAPRRPDQTLARRTCGERLLQAVLQRALPQLAAPARRAAHGSHSPASTPESSLLTHRSRQRGQGRQAGGNIPGGSITSRRKAVIGDARAPLPRDCRGVSQTRFIGSAQSIGHRVHLAPIEDLHRALQAVSLDGPHRPGHAELMGSTCSLTAELASGSRPPCVPKAMPPARSGCEQPAAATPRADRRHRRSMGCAQRRPASRQRRDRPLA